jgi:hypothetical protein
MLRGEHWLIEAYDATELVGKPLSRMLENSGGNTAKKVESALLPASLITGVVTLVAAPIYHERNITNAKRQRNTKETTADFGGAVSTGTESNTNGSYPATVRGYTEPAFIRLNDDSRDFIAGPN